jgi:hypothetical protein
LGVELNYKLYLLGNRKSERKYYEWDYYVECGKGKNKYMPYMNPYNSFSRIDAHLQEQQDTYICTYAQIKVVWSTENFNRYDVYI